MRRLIYQGKGSVWSTSLCARGHVNCQLSLFRATSELFCGHLAVNKRKLSSGSGHLSVKVDTERGGQLQQEASLPHSHFGAALGDLHKRTWNAQHLKALEEQCGKDMSKWREVLVDLSNQGKSIYMRAVLSRMTLLGLNVDGALVRLFLKSCLKSKKPTLAYEFLEQYSSHTTLHRDLYLFALKLCGMCGDPDTATQIVGIMHARGCDTVEDNSVLTSQMHAFAKAGNLQGALSIIKLIHDQSSDVIAGSQLSTDDLLQLPGISLTDYNILLNACAYSGNLDTAQLILRNIQAKNFRPTAHTWRAMIQAAIKSHRLDEGLAYLNAMVEECDGARNPHCFNSFLAAYSKDGNSERFNEIFRCMVSADVPFDDYTYSILLASVANGLIDETSIAIDHLRSEMHHPLTTSASEKCNGSNLDEITLSQEPYEVFTEIIVKHMFNKQLVMSNYTWRVASAPYADGLNYDGLQRLIACINCFDPNVNNLAEIPKKQHRERFFEKWHQLRLSMLRDSIGYLGRLGRADEAYEKVKTFHLRNVHNGSQELHDEKNCWLRVVRAYAEGQKDWRRALEVLDDMRQRGYKISPSLWKYVFKEHASSENANTFTEIVRMSFAKDGVLPDDESWNLLIESVRNNLIESDVNDNKTKFDLEAEIFKKMIFKSCPVSVRKYIVASTVRYLESKMYDPEIIRKFVGEYVRPLGLQMAELKNTGVVPARLPEWNLSDVDKDEENSCDVQSKKVTNQSYLLRIKRAAFQKDVVACFQVYDELINSFANGCNDGALLTSDFFYILLSMSLKYNYRVEDADDIFSLALDMEIKPTKDVCWQMLRVYARTKNVPGAIKIAEHYRSVSVNDKDCDSALDAMHLKIIGLMDKYANDNDAVVYIQRLLENDVKSSRLYAALILEHLKLNDISKALSAMEELFQESSTKMLMATRFIDIACEKLLNEVINNSSIAYYKKSRIIDRLMKALVKKQLKALQTFSLYADYLISDQNDIYACIDVLNEMSLIFGQEASSIWEVREHAILALNSTILYYFCYRIC